MQLSPNSLIPVSYTASIPGDTTVYFVQAVLRDTQSSTVLQTLNLTNVSSVPNRYTGNFKPVSDPQGLGRPIDITVSVYTDSGHTTLSPNYQILQLNYTILQPWIQNLGMGGGLNIDYDKLQKMFDGSKVTNAEIGNEKAPRRERVNYKRLEEGTLGAHEATRAALSEEIKGHIGTLSKLVSDVAKGHGDVGTLTMERFDKLEEKINSIDLNLGQGQKMSQKERAEVKNELLKSVSEFREEFGKTSKEGSKKSEEIFKKAIEGLQEYMGDNLSEKEIKMVYNMAPAKREKEKSNSFAPEDISALFRS